NTISSPASGTAPAAITVPPPRTRTSQDRSTTVPAGIPPSGDATVRVASTTSGTVESTRAPWHRAGFDTHTLTRSPTCLQTTAKHQVTASSKPTALSPWCWGDDIGELLQRPAGLEGLGVVHDRREPQGAFAFGITLQGQVPEVDLELGQVIRRCLDRDLQPGRPAAPGGARTAPWRRTAWS